MKGRRLCRVNISPDILPIGFRTGVFFEVIEGIPEGAEFRGFTVDHARNEICMFVEHESFAFVPDGCEAPVLSLVCETFDEPAIQAYKRFIANFKKENNG